MARWQVTLVCSAGHVSTCTPVLCRGFCPWACCHGRIHRSSSSFFFFFFFLLLSACSCPLLLGPPFFLLCPFRLQKQQWQQMKMKAMRTTKGRPISTARQTVLKTPSSCLVRISSKMELKKELIFCSMLAPGQAACAALST
uniref:Uncharacterized protein n=1 Tax=Falco tinnunculus TaxID=100819 RepID=A0A8C4VCF3_FALTI